MNRPLPPARILRLALQAALLAAARALVAVLTPAVEPVSGVVSRRGVIFAVDIVGFNSGGGDDEVQLAMRGALYRLLSDAFGSSGVPWDDCEHEDRGDGVLVIMPPRVQTAVVLGQLMAHLRAGLCRYNRLSSGVAQIRLRVAVHVGEVHRDGHGLAGVAVNHLFRLLEAPAFKAVFSACPGVLGLIVSDYVYQSVVRFSPGLVDAAAYHRIAATHKETDALAWVHAPGVPSREFLKSSSN